ncbi:beta-1,4 N-acetylgalactosaminyltransferase 1 isoform X2 [Protopterus annectens]|uniref:beta-1,4 N-acetylgalactosaminyltransferase 1 isoform X2 n=1 Tax=Protopterus annectens TaxID=7888 RepID=UPI001CFB57E2|nr:beta-1,4 N-acetylgalactosaminyltransferase 1 isoform X2 [Protopterus annectens]
MYFLRMWRAKKKLLCACIFLLALCIFIWAPKRYSALDISNRMNSVPEVLLDERLWAAKTYEHIHFRVKGEAAGLLAKNVCRCENEEMPVNIPLSKPVFHLASAVQLKRIFSISELEDLQKKRDQEYQKFLKRSQSPLDLLIIAKANSPLEYPVQGLQVRPLKSILIPGLSLQASTRDIYRVNLTASLGIFQLAAEVDEVSFQGDGEMHLSLSSPQTENLNKQLQFVMYTNTLFHPNTADIVHFTTDGYEAYFSIKVQHPTPPKLYHPGTSGEYDISALVTIATKTFLRYSMLRKLIKSIRKYYPTVKIVIADDSNVTEKVEGPNIEQYFMPFEKGWFAGRNLAISQVTTKYFLWVDDDFIFTNETKIEKLVDVLEKTTLDVVGGAVREVTGYSTTYRQKITVEAGGDDGDCLHTRQGFHHIIKGFPNCVVTDGVINFFLARTEKARQVGFDPKLNRVAHLEFFIDGLGILHVGSCDDVVVSHASKIRLPWTKTKEDKLYATYRYPKALGSNKDLQYRLFYFKNRFKCMTGN